MAQVQWGGKDNIQIEQHLTITLSQLLNQTEAHLNDRSFTCPEVKKRYTDLLSQLSQWIHSNEGSLSVASTFMAYPFKTLPEGALQNNGFVEALLEALTLIAFSDISYDFENHHINLRLNGNQSCGMYYHSPGSHDLVDSFVRLIKCLKDKGTELPLGMIFIILRCVSGDTHLEPAKIKNVLETRDILGSDPYIKPLQTGSPQCVNLTSYVISNCKTLDEAQDFIKGVLGIA